MEGYPFTWFKSLGTIRVVEEKLDRALVTSSWLQLFPNAKLESLVAPSSDHFPILLVKHPVAHNLIVKRSFKFENAWRIEERINEVVQNSWSGSTSNNIIHKLSNCAEELSHWSKTHCNKLRVDIDNCRKQLDRNRSTTGIRDEIQFDNLRHKLNHLLVQEDMYWRQRAKTH